MSKKRKTRKQKEQAHQRHVEQVQHIHIDTPTYSVSGLKAEPIATASKSKQPAVKIDKNAFLKKDMLSIAAASGIIVAFDILLFALLSSGILKLNFLGY